MQQPIDNPTGRYLPQPPAASLPGEYEATLHIRLLGEFQLIIQGATLTGITLRMQALIAFLLLHQGIPQPRQYVAFQLWPDSTEARALNSLRKLLFELRAALPLARELITSDRQYLAWRPDSTKIQVTVDVLSFAYLAAQHDSQSSLDQAAVLYKDDLLPGIYDDWIFPWRERYHQMYVSLLERLILRLEHQRAYTAAIAYSEQWLKQEPLQEVAYQALMRLHALQGNRAGVTRAYQRCVSVLQRELGQPPGEATLIAYYQHSRASMLAVGGAHAAGAPSANPSADALSYLQPLLEKQSAKPGRLSATTAPITEQLGDVLRRAAQHDQAQAAYTDAQHALPAEDQLGHARLQRKIGEALAAQHRFAEALEVYANAAADVRPCPGSGRCSLRKLRV